MQAKWRIWLEPEEGEEMIEIRKVVFGKNVQLEYRYLKPNIDASGAFCPPGEWSDWQLVKTVTGDEAAMEDLIESGGIQGAP